MFAALEPDEEAVCYLPRYPPPDDPFKYRSGLSSNLLKASPQGYNVEALFRQGRTLLTKPGARHIKSMRRWVEAHVSLLDELPGKVLVQQMYAADDGYSPKQLELVSAAASVASFLRCQGATTAGLDVELVQNLYSKSRKEVEAQYLVTIDITSADIAQVRMATQFICGLYEDLLRLLPSLPRCFEQECPDYQLRNPLGDANTQWSVTAEDRRTKEFIAEYCRDEDDARRRLALMREHKYRFKSLAVESPGEGKRRFLMLFEGLEPTSQGDSEWPFPTRSTNDLSS